MSIHLIIFLLIVFSLLAALYPLINYPKKAHKKALRKAGFILGISFVPALAVLVTLGGKESILYGELFIYSATYLAPVFYWFYERIDEDIADGKKIKGDYLMLIISFFIFVLTLSIFVAFKFESKLFIENYPSPTPLLILSTTIILWYSIIAFEKSPKTFLEKSRREEENFIDEVTS